MLQFKRPLVSKTNWMKIWKVTTQVAEVNLLMRNRITLILIKSLFSLTKSSKKTERRYGRNTIEHG